jgi:signal transduction histidine kinase
LNAVDASPNASSVTVRLQSNEDNAVISIEDSGNGISEENAARIFEPFFTTKSSGTGLGLAIAKNIVDKHKGQIQLKNITDGGAVAEVSLPLLKAGVIS